VASHFADISNLVLVLLGGGPSARRDGVDVLDVHGVNLLESSVLGLYDEEEDNQDKGSTAASEDETVEVVNVVGNEAGAKITTVNWSHYDH
jgi:hypothetical protein